MLRRFIAFTNEQPIVRGMLSYSILWPTGNIIEQTFIEKRNFKTYDWKKCLRFSLYGACVMGPSLFFWMRFLSQLYPPKTLKYSMIKAVTEQFTYDPTAICVFLFSMTLVEGKTFKAAKQEVKSKFWDTYKVGAFYWTTVQTINFALVPLRNQVIYLSFFSMLWSSFLAYMKHLELEAQSKKLNSQNEM